MRLIVNITSLLSVSKLKLTSPCYLPYPDAFPGVVVPPAKQALKSTPATSTPLAAPPAGSTRSHTRTANVAPVSNTRACSCTASVAPEASVNKYRRLSTPSPLGPPKPGQRAKPIKVT